MRAAVVCLLAAARIVDGVCDPGTNADTRAPSYVRCPVCPRDTWVTITNEWTILDFQAVVVDSCGRTHFHDKGRYHATYHCVACCYEWESTKYTADSCWCGYNPDDDTNWTDPCGALPLTATGIP